MVASLRVNLSVRIMSKDFRRQDYHRYKKLGKKWRKPKGRQSKLRRGKAGNSPKPSIGFRTERKDRYKISGKLPVVVNNINDLKKITEEKVAVISGKIGLRKLSVILKEAEKRKIAIVNTKRKKKVERREKAIKGRAKKEDKKKKKTPEKKNGKE